MEVTVEGDQQGSPAGNHVGFSIPHHLSGIRLFTPHVLFRRLVRPLVTILPELKTVLPNVCLRRGFGWQADFVIEGYVDPKEPLREEGPFGDHTGYYTLTEPYPVFHATAITHRKDAVYPATIVGNSGSECVSFPAK
jgi:hypothetical protein